jgi:hypothetical protein
MERALGLVKPKELSLQAAGGGELAHEVLLLHTCQILN